MLIKKTLILRGKKEILAVFNTNAKLSGKQDTGRPQATLDFINYISGLPLNAKTEQKLKRAAVASKAIDVSDISDDLVPTSIKIPIELEKDVWDAAMDVFRFVFKLDLNRTPQTPYFIKVAGLAYLEEMREKNAALGINNMNALMPEEFAGLDLNSKLDEIYKLLLTIQSRANLWK